METTIALREYRAGTLIKIGSRRFRKIPLGSFWREEDSIPGNCVARPAITLETMQITQRTKHEVIEFPKV